MPAHNTADCSLLRCPWNSGPDTEVARPTQAGDGGQILSVQSAARKVGDEVGGGGASQSKAKVAVAQGNNNHCVNSSTES